MEIPLYLSGRQIGRIAVVPEAEATCFSVEASAPAGLYRLLLCGERGELPLGVWEGGVMRRRFSHRLTASAGRFLSGEAFSLNEASDWHSAAPADFPDWPTTGGLCRRRKEVWELALPFPPDGPFPIPELFCVSTVRRIGDRQMAVFCFDRQGKPTFPVKN